MPITIQQSLEQAKETLSIANPDSSASLDAELLLARVLDKNRSYLFAFGEIELTATQSSQFNSAINEAKTGKPIAYIIGSKGFWDLDLFVNEHVLIPRPDTEVLVESIIDIYNSRYKQVSALNILDLGTGSGAIALALKSALPRSQIYALDYNYKALDVCQKNKRLNQLEISLINGSWLDAIQTKSFDIIVSNPPYIDENDRHLSQLSYEPLSALVAEDNGLADYKYICSQALRVLKSQGLLAFEHGFEQAQSVSQIMKLNHFTEIISLKDYGGNDRVTLGYKG